MPPTGRRCTMQRSNFGGIEQGVADAALERLLTSRCA
jgi:hypothetical protein